MVHEPKGFVNVFKNRSLLRHVAHKLSLLMHEVEDVRVSFSRMSRQ